MNLKVMVLDKSAEKFGLQARKTSRKLAALLKEKGAIEVYLISGVRMRRLNKMFRKKDKPANVLSFAKPKNFPGQELGEVYLDPIYIKSRGEDIDLMLTHGVLHILGYDHEKRSDRIKMEKMEQFLLQKLVICK